MTDEVGYVCCHGCVIVMRVVRGFAMVAEVLSL